MLDLSSGFPGNMSFRSSMVSEFGFPGTQSSRSPVQKKCCFLLENKIWAKHQHQRMQHIDVKAVLSRTKKQARPL